MSLVCAIAISVPPPLHFTPSNSPCSPGSIPSPNVLRHLVFPVLSFPFCPVHMLRSEEVWRTCFYFCPIWPLLLSDSESHVCQKCVRNSTRLPCSTVSTILAKISSLQLPFPFRIHSFVRRVGLGKATYWLLAMLVVRAVLGIKISFRWLDILTPRSCNKCALNNFYKFGKQWDE